MQERFEACSYEVVFLLSLAIILKTRVFLLQFGKRRHFSLSPLTSCYVASINPQFGTSLARRLNQCRVFAVLQSNLIATDFSTGESRRLDEA